MCKINGVKLTEMREKAGMSQNALAKKLGVAESTISNYETGRSNPSEEKVDKICFILKINKDDIEIHDVGYSFSDSMGKTYEKYDKRVTVDYCENAKCILINVCGDTTIIKDLDRLNDFGLMMKCMTTVRNLYEPYND